MAQKPNSKALAFSYPVTQRIIRAIMDYARTHDDKEMRQVGRAMIKQAQDFKRQKEKEASQ